MVYGSIYDIPPEIGMFDISFLGCILLHLRDPFLALQKAATITKETIIVTDLVPSGFISCDRTIKLRLKSSLQILLFKFKDMFNINPIEFAPNPPAREPLNIWWYYSPRMICRFLKVLGFQNTFISYHYQKFVPSNSYVYLYSVVGKK